MTPRKIDVTSTYKGIGDGSIIGQFVENHFRLTFEFSKNNDGGQFADHPHIVWFSNTNERRYATVKKTVVYLVVDEALDGSAVIQKWHIRNLRTY